MNSPVPKAIPHNVPKNINNLPGPNFVVTQEILINNVCRICATYFETGPDLVPLYSKVNSRGVLAEIANDFLPIKLVQGDGLPEVACATCEHDLRAWRRLYDDSAGVQKSLATHAERASRIQYYSIPRPENGVTHLHFVDLTDSDSESQDAGPLPPPDPQEDGVYISGSWAIYARARGIPAGSHLDGISQQIR